jgi:hypothetical protein
MFFAHPNITKETQYCHHYNNQADTISNIFDSARYKQLHEAKVVIKGKEQHYKYFEEEHEIAFSLSVDGMCPFKRQKNGCWPLLLIDFNLPPDKCTHINNITLWRLEVLNLGNLCAENS